MSQLRSRISVLTPREMDRIYEASLRILERTGMRFDDDGFLDALEARGCRVDRAARVARFPESLLRETTALVAADHDRDAASAPPPPPQDRRPRTHAYGWGGGPALYFADVAARQIRRGTAADALRIIHFADAHPDIRGVSSTMLVFDRDLDGRPFDPRLYTLKALALTAKHTAKVSYCENISHVRELEYIEEIARILKPDVPPAEAGFASTARCVISPLRLERESCELLRHFALRGYFCAIATMPIAGATAPATLAGTLALANAEILGGFAALKAIHPAVRCGWVYYGAALDPRRGVASFGGPEVLLTHLALSQLCTHFYHTHRHGIGSLYGDGRLPTRQAAVERGFYYLMGALSGFRSLGHFGFTGQGQILSLEGALADLETAKWVNRLLQGFETSAETLADEIVGEVGVGGNFLSEPHTAAHMRTEYWLPDLLDRNTAELDWERIQKSELLQAAQERVREILSHHTPYELAPDKAAEIDRVLAAAEKDRSW